MDRMLVVVFDSESRAYRGKEALLALDDDHKIGVYACVVISPSNITTPVLVAVSQATRDIGSCSMHASNTASDI